MRYFISSTFPKAFLSLRIVEPTFSAFCVFLRGPFPGSQKGFFTAGDTAITRPPITVTTDQCQLIAKYTVKQTTTHTHWLKITVRAGSVADKVPGFLNGSGFIPGG